MTWGRELDAAFPPGRWHGKWIWAEGSPANGSTRSVVALRSELSLDDVPASVPARMLAIARYALSVNGQEVARGPMRANPRRQPYDVLDLAPFLKSGANRIDALCWWYTDAMAWWMPLPPGSDIASGAFVFEA